MSDEERAAILSVLRASRKLAHALHYTELMQEIGAAIRVLEKHKEDGR